MQALKRLPTLRPSLRDEEGLSSYTKTKNLEGQIMRKMSTLLAILSICILESSYAQQQQLRLGTDAVVENKLYVVYSGMSWSDTGRLAETSNIYVIKGLDDTVWVYGAGYVDPQGEIPVSRPGRDTTRNGQADAADADRVITQFFGFKRESVKFMFIVPHYHLDHLNVEFLKPFFDQFGYNRGTAKIFIHTSDYFPAVCTADSSCGGIRGGPENPPWSSASYLLNMIEKLGTPTDACNAVVKTFQSPSGTWQVKKDQNVSAGGHTDGAINLDLSDLKYRFWGAGARNQCGLPSDWIGFRIHGNIVVPSTNPPLVVTSVSAASYSGSALAPEAIVAAFGSNLATSTLAASTLPLPVSLAGTSLKVKDSAGAERLAPLFFVSPTQVNCQIPAGTANGAATITITSGDGSVSTGTTQITSIAPGLFTVAASGQGVAAAIALRIKADGSQSYEPVARFDPAQNKFVAAPIDLGPETDRVFLILFGTGIRYRSALSAVTAKLGGTDAQVMFAGALDGFVGLDQVNVSLPRSLIGRGEVDIALTADGQAANTVKVTLK